MEKLLQPDEECSKAVSRGRKAQVNRREFPESDKPLKKAYLLASYAAPAIAKATAARVDAKTAPLAGKVHKMRDFRPHPAAFILASVLIFAGFNFSTSHQLATDVLINGESVGAVANRQVYQDARAYVRTAASEVLGYEYDFEGEKISTMPVFAKKTEVMDQEALENAICDASGIMTYSYVLNVNGQAVGATSRFEAIEDLMKQKLNAYVTDSTISSEFVEDIAISHEIISNDAKNSFGDIETIINGTKQQELTYTIKDGDTWSEIAEAYEMSSADLLALNPGCNISLIHINQKLVVNEAVPLLTVKTLSHENYADAVPYEIERRDDSSMYVGQTKVLTAGVNGTADVVANVSYINGIESQRDIVSSVTTVEPVTEVLAVGTKARPKTMASGSFRWPASGKISSRYGYRTVLGVYRMHKGIDISGSYGAPIYAADGGTVTYSGWMSGYGYLVIITHNNGYTTYYGHNSKLLVSNGTKVYKGQQIAKMGSTGRSTGNHCHFEIRYNGSTVNPLNYLP